jgi:hypothetical protein
MMGYAPGWLQARVYGIMARVQKMDDQTNKTKYILVLRESWTNNICTIVIDLFQQSSQGLISLMDIFHRSFYKMFWQKLLPYQQV